MWPDRRLLDLLGVELPIIQTPMAGANGSAMAIAVCEAGGLGSLPCAMLDAAKVRAEIGTIRQRTGKPINVNFFCHAPAKSDPARDAAWKLRLAPYYSELGLDPAAEAPAVNRAPFDEAMCGIVEDLAPEVVSFHFGLPAPDLLSRVRAAGCRVLSSATTVAEARWLENRSCDAIIAQGCEAGGHRGMFLDGAVAAQPGTLALVPQVADAVQVPVIAAGGIADGRGIAAALMLGADGVLVGSRLWASEESLAHPDMIGAAIAATGDDTIRSNVMDVARRLNWPARYTARVLKNAFTERWHDDPEGLIADAAAQSARWKAAWESGDTDTANTFVGEAAGLIHDRPPAERLVTAMAAEAEALLLGGWRKGEP